MLWSSCLTSQHLSQILMRSQVQLDCGRELGFRGRSPCCVSFLEATQTLTVGLPPSTSGVLLCHLSSCRKPKTGSKWELCSLLLPPAKHSHQHKCMPVLAPVSGHPHGFLHCKLRVGDESINHYSLPGSLCSFELLPTFVAMSGRLGLHLPTSPETPNWVGFLAAFLKTFHTRAPGGASWSLWQILCTFTYLVFPSSPSWKSIIDHLLTHEKTMFKDLMSKFRGTCL